MTDINKILKLLVGQAVKLVDDEYYVWDYLFQPSYLHGKFSVYNTEFEPDDVVSITIDQLDITIKLG